MFAKKNGKNGKKGTLETMNMGLKKMKYQYKTHKKVWILIKVWSMTIKPLNRGWKETKADCLCNGRILNVPVDLSRRFKLFIKKPKIHREKFFQKKNNQKLALPHQTSITHQKCSIEVSGQLKNVSSRVCAL